MLYHTVPFTMRRTASARPHATLPLLGVLVGALLAALPAAPVAAAAPAPEIAPIPAPSAEEVLNEIPLGDLNLTELSELLARRPGLEDLPEGALKDTIEEVLEVLAGEGDTIGNLGEPAQLAPKVEEAIEGLLSHTELVNLLKGEGLDEVLTGALGSLDPTQLVFELVASSGHPEEVITQALDAVDPETLESAIGSTLAGEPFSKTSVGELASSYGTTESGFTEAMGTSSEQLPPTAMALTAPLSNGKTLGVLEGAEGLSLATLTGEGAGGGTGGLGGVGGVGGRGGAGGNLGETLTGGTSPSSTIVINVPSPTGSTPAAGAAAAGKLKVISHKVKGRTATVVVQVPGPGRLSLSGRRVKSVTEQTAASERATIKTTLTKAGVAQRRRHPKGITVRLKVSFKPVSGSASAAVATARFA